MTSPGMWVAAIAAAIYIAYPEECSKAFWVAYLHLQIMDLNRKLKAQQWKLYVQINREHRLRGWPELPPFEFVPVQHRSKL